MGRHWQKDELLEKVLVVISFGWKVPAFQKATLGAAKARSVIIVIVDVFAFQEVCKILLSKEIDKN